MSAELTHAIRYAEAALDGADAQSSIVLGAALQRVLSALSTPPSDDVREALEAIWDDGNATGLDGWVGPGRGTTPVDVEARVARERAIQKHMRAFEVRPRGTVTDAPSRPTQDGGVWGSYVAYLRDLEAHVAAS